MIFENPYSKQRDSYVTMGAHGNGMTIDESPQSIRNLGPNMF